jgi:hypothetical protein
MLTLNALFVSLLLSCRLSLTQGPYSGKGCLSLVRRLKLLGLENHESKRLWEKKPLRDLTDITYRRQQPTRLGELEVPWRVVHAWGLKRSSLYWVHTER